MCRQFEKALKEFIASSHQHQSRSASLEEQLKDSQSEKNGLKTSLEKLKSRMEEMRGGGGIGGGSGGIPEEYLMAKEQATKLMVSRLP